jgi:hypothetical protein
MLAHLGCLWVLHANKRVCQKDTTR